MTEYKLHLQLYKHIKLVSYNSDWMVRMQYLFRSTYSAFFIKYKEDDSIWGNISKRLSTKPIPKIL